MSSHNLIWIDLEMTGLDVDQDSIIEIATVVTNTELEVIAEGPTLAIHQPLERLQSMDSWNTKQHNESGLVKRVIASTITAAEAEERTVNFLMQHVKPGTSPMCGNSICQDRRFLHREMPTLERFFHYRHIDVTTIKLLANYWAPTMEQLPAKQSSHLALQDIYDSINELKHYRRVFLQANIT